VNSLKSFPLFYPLNLILGVLNYKAITFAERLSLTKVFLKLPFYSGKKLTGMNIKGWLENENQTKNIQDAFWRILAVGALNTGIEKASAKIFVDMLKQIFLNGKKAATIILPEYGLSESFCDNAKDFILKNGGEIILSDLVNKLSLQDNRIVELKTSANTYSDFDYVVSAMPPFALPRIFDEELRLNIPEFTYSSLLNIHVWLKKNTFPSGFFGLINSPLHWVFNKGTHLNVVISNADELVKKSDEDLLLMVKTEMNKFFSLNPDLISNYKIIKEKRSTFIPSNDVLDRRPRQKTKIKNLILAGDWVDTGLPSTIESAVKSGRVAAEIILGSNL